VEAAYALIETICPLVLNPNTVSAKVHGCGKDDCLCKDGKEFQTHPKHTWFPFYLVTKSGVGERQTAM